MIGAFTESDVFTSQNISMRCVMLFQFDTGTNSNSGNLNNKTQFTGLVRNKI